MIRTVTLATSDQHVSYLPLGSNNIGRSKIRTRSSGASDVVMDMLSFTVLRWKESSAKRLYRDANLANLGKFLLYSLQVPYSLPM